MIEIPLEVVFNKSGYDFFKMTMFGLKFIIMKKTLFLSFFVALGSIALSQNCTYYEYKITSENPSDEISGFLKCYNMGGSSRVESTFRMPEIPKSLTRTTSLSKNETPNKIFMLIPAGKMYSEVSFAEFSEAGRPKESYDLNFLGNEIVNGYNAIHIVSKYTSGKLKAEVWISKSVPGFQHYLVSRANKFFNDEEFFKLVTGKGIEGIPVRIKTVEFGKTVIFDLVTAEKRDVENSFFEVPSDYEKASPVKLSTVENVAEDMQNMTAEEVDAFLKQLKKNYGLD